MRAVRYHDLDALRATAMLLGVVLHACGRFVPWYPEDDALSHSVLGDISNFIHGFRMPLFFFISGFFTALLWQQRGLRPLLRHRIKRILIPLAWCVVTLLPLIQWSFWGGRELADADPDVRPSNWGFTIPIWDLDFVHLWFLWMLCYLLAGFALAVWSGRQIRATWPRAAQQCDRPAVFVALMVAVSLIGQYNMAGTFGPGFTADIILDPVVLGYYAAFFAAGAVCFRPGIGLWPVLERLTDRWVAFLVVGLVCATFGRILSPENMLVARPLQVAFAWTFIVALMGLFRKFASRPSYRMRWLSDASYWTYLLHFPVVQVLQGAVATWDVPVVIRLVAVMAATTAICLLTYQYLVRYTFIGTALNGPRQRPSVGGPAQVA